MGPRRNQRYPYKREAEGDLTLDRRKGKVTRTQRPEHCSHKPRNVSSHQKLEEARNGFPPRASRGSTALPTP